MICGASHGENKTQKEEGAWVEESVAWSLGHAHFAHRRCRWVILSLDHYWMMTKPLSSERTMAKGRLKSDVQIEKELSVMDGDYFPFFLNVRQTMKKWGERHQHK